MNLNNSINSLDGKGLYYSFLAGAQRIFDHQSHLNKINVFPVADADTGTNLASTMRSIVDTNIPTDNLKVTAAALADAALIGARGNSGIIFAQFLYGFSNEINNSESINTQSFADILKKSVSYAYEAISNPREGTMITVIREWADSVYDLKDKLDDFTELIKGSYRSAQQSLKETTDKLEELAKANVVDAGAKGFVYFLEGMIDFFGHGEIKKILQSRNILKVKSFDEISHDNPEFRYCTEALINGMEIDKLQLRNKIEPLGDSLVIAGSKEKIRIHIHTDDPSYLFEQVRDFGQIAYQKVDDMVFQNHIATSRLAKTAIVTDSTSDLPRALLDKHQIHVVPLSLHMDGHLFLDGVTLSPEQFYRNLPNASIYPSSAQPSFKEFTNKYAYLSTHYDNIIALHISGALSGTFSNSTKAARTIQTQTKTPIHVVDSLRTSASLGLQVLRLAREIEAGMSYEDAIINAETWKKKVGIWVTSKTVKYMVKSGRVSPMKGAIAKALGVKPIVSVDHEGKAYQFGKPFTEKESMKKVMRSAEKFMKQGKIWGYSVTNAENQKAADWYIKKMQEHTGKDPEFVGPGSPVLGTNVGPGVVSLNIMLD